MLQTAVDAERALAMLRRDADERLAGLLRSPRPRFRARLGRRLVSWGERLASAERDAPSPARFAATMVP